MIIQQNNNIRFCSRAYGIPNHRLLAKMTVSDLRFLPMDQTLNLIRKQLLTTHQLCHHCTSTHILPGRLVFQYAKSNMGYEQCLFSLAAYIAPSSIRKASQQGRRFVVGLRLVCLCPTAKACGFLTKQLWWISKSKGSNPTLQMKKLISEPKRN